MERKIVEAPQPCQPARVLHSEGNSWTAALSRICHLARKIMWVAPVLPGHVATNG